MSGRASPDWAGRLARLAVRGHAGGVIRPHRAIARVRRSPGDALLGVLLPAAFTVAQALALPPLLRFWRAVLAFWSARLALGAGVVSSRLTAGSVAIDVPALDGVGGAVTDAAFWWTLVGALGAWLLSYLLRPDRWLPLVYLVRVGAFVQGVALAFYLVAPASFPASAEPYLAAELTTLLGLMFLAPWLLGLTYDVFEFPLHQKAALALLVLAWLAVAAPMQVLLHAWAVTHLSLLALPLLYLLGGLLVDVLALVAWYAWGMSWRWASPWSPDR